MQLVLDCNVFHERYPSYFFSQNSFEIPFILRISYPKNSKVNNCMTQLNEQNIPCN
jgi:hypothetical protein